MYIATESERRDQSGDRYTTEHWDLTINCNIDNDLNNHCVSGWENSAEEWMRIDCLAYKRPAAQHSALFYTHRNTEREKNSDDKKWRWIASVGPSARSMDRNKNIDG